MAKHSHRHHHIAAIFGTVEAAEVAIEDLRARGLGSEELGAAVHDPSRHVFEEDADADVVRDAERGVALGVPIGALAGIALAVPGAGTIGVGGILAIGAATGFGGSMLGGLLGVAVADDAWELHEDLGDVALRPGEIMVAACAHDQPTTVAEVFRAHGGRIIEQT